MIKLLDKILGYILIGCSVAVCVAAIATRDYIQIVAGGVLFLLALRVMLGIPR